MFAYESLTVNIWKITPKPELKGPTSYLIKLFFQIICLLLQNSISDISFLLEVLQNIIITWKHSCTNFMLTIFFWVLCNFNWVLTEAAEGNELYNRLSFQNLVTITYRGCHPEVFCKKGVFKNWKHLKKKTPLPESHFFL